MHIRPSKELPHKINCRVGLLQPARLSLKNLTDRPRTYDFKNGQLRWQFEGYSPGIILNDEVRPSRTSSSNRGILFTTRQEGIHYALGGAATGWLFSSAELQDPSDIVIPTERLQPFDLENTNMMSYIMHPTEVQEAVATLQAIQRIFRSNI